MPTKFSTSTNIIRDSSRDIRYIPTVKGKRIANQISTDFFKGLRSFNIIGSYGTGKSSFLWALQQSLAGKKTYFTTSFFPNPKVKFINIVGEFKSIKNAFADYFDMPTNKSSTELILSEIFNAYYDLGKKKPFVSNSD